MYGANSASHFLQHYYDSSDDYESDDYCDGDDDSDDSNIEADSLISYSEWLSQREFKSINLPALKSLSNSRKTMLNVLPPEIVMQIIDFIIPFFSCYQEAKLLNKKDIMRATLSQMKLKLGLVGMVNQRHYKLGYSQVKQYQTFHANNSFSVTSSIMKRKVCVDVMDTIRNLLLVNKETFYHVLITSCRVNTIRKFWECLHYLLYERDDSLSLDHFKASTILQQVMDAVEEPVFFCEAFLSSSLFGFANAISEIMPQGSISNGNLLPLIIPKLGHNPLWIMYIDNVEHYLNRHRFILRQSKFSEWILAELIHFSTFFEDCQDTIIPKRLQEIYELVFLKYEIPIFGGTTDTTCSILTNCLSIDKRLFLKVLSVTTLSNLTDAKRSVMSHLISYAPFYQMCVSNQEYDILFLIMENCSLDEIKDIHLHDPLHSLIYSALNATGSNNSSTIEIMTSIRKHYLDTSQHKYDPLVGSQSNIALYLVSCTIEVLKSNQKKGVMKVFCELYRHIIGLVDENIISNSTYCGYNIMFIAVENCQVLSFLLDPKEQSGSLISVYQTLLTQSKQNMRKYSIFHKVLDDCFTVQRYRYHRSTLVLQQRPKPILDILNKNIPSQVRIQIVQQTDVEKKLDLFHKYEKKPEVDIVLGETRAILLHK